VSIILQENKNYPKILTFIIITRTTELQLLKKQVLPINWAFITIIKYYATLKKYKKSSLKNSSCFCRDQILCFCKIIGIIQARHNYKDLLLANIQTELKKRFVVVVKSL